MKRAHTYGSGPVRVAVVHGGPGAPGSVAPVARRLGETRGVLEPIQTATTLQGQVAELHQMLAEHTSRPVALIGHSWGAWLSYLVAAQHPADVRSLILVGSGPFAEHYVPLIAANRRRRLGQQAWEEYQQLLEQWSQPESGTSGSTAALARLGALGHRSDSYDPIAAQDIDPAPGEKQGEIYRNVWAAAAELRRTGALLSLARHISCPVLAIHGEQDPHPAAGVQEPLAASLPDFRMLVLPQCGHQPWQERRARAQFYLLLEQELTRVGA
jgi:pimeloyl-ACP methyl ester carboxylesterase